MEEIRAHQLFGEWTTEYWGRAVTVDTDFAPDDEAHKWVGELVSGALAAMTNVGVEVTRSGPRTADEKIFVTLDGQDFVAREMAADSLDVAVTAILGRLDAIAAAQGHRERWYVCGDPVGSGFFVTPEELITSAGVDVRELDIGEVWYQISSD